MLRLSAAALVLLLLATVPAAAETLDFPRALRLTLENHPRVQARAREVEAAQRDVAQAGRLPRPVLALEAENLAGTDAWSGLGGSEWTAVWSQTLPLGGLRAARTAVSRQELARAELESDRTRLEILGDTHLAFLDVLAAQEEVAVRNELVVLADRLVEDVARRVAAGATLRAEESRARVSAASYRLERSRAEARLVQARSALARALGLTTLPFDAVEGEIFLGAEPPPLEELRARLDGTSSLALAAAETERWEALARLEEASGAGDLELAGGARYDAGGRRWGLVAQVAVPLPLNDRRTAAAAAARLRAHRAAASRDDLRIGLEDALTRLHTGMAASHQALVLLQEEILPAAQEAFDAVQDAYVKGRASLTDVLDAEATLGELSRRRIAVAHEHHAAYARLQALLDEAPHGISLAPEEG
jgi:cobalt-zinc-cadmium efflux system outer membrane protein